MKSDASASRTEHRTFDRTDFYTPHELKRFEPHHVVFARFGTDWYSSAATNGIGQVLIGKGQEPLIDAELTFKFYRDHAGKEPVKEPWQR